MYYRWLGLCKTNWTNVLYTAVLDREVNYFSAWPYGLGKQGERKINKPVPCGNREKNKMNETNLAQYFASDLLIECLLGNLLMKQLYLPLFIYVWATQIFDLYVMYLYI